MKIKVLLAVTLTFITIHSSGQSTSRLLIAAASDLKFALDSVVHVFENINKNVTIDITYGSSGKLSEQITNGAPFDLFFSADIDYPKKLQEKGLVISEIRSYGFGRIVIWSSKIDPSTLGMNSLLDAEVFKIAIANPAHAPYGKRAEEALKNYGIYEKIKNKLVFGENISQTAQFITSGAADIGIVALSLALAPNMKKEKGIFYIIPDTHHRPLEQAFVVLGHAQGNKLALTFGEFMESSQAKNILKHFGFTGTE